MTTTRGRTSSEMSSSTGTYIESREHSYAEKFRPLYVIKNLAPDAYYGWIAVRSDCDAIDLDEFRSYCKLLGVSMKTWIYKGTLVVTEVSTHTSHGRAASYFTERLAAYQLVTLGLQDRHDMLAGSSDVTESYDHSVLSADASFGYRLRESPSLVVEVANTQTVTALMTKASMYMSVHNLRILILVKYWYTAIDHVPMVVLVYRKAGEVVTPAELVPTHFISFGDVTPTQAEMNPFFNFVAAAGEPALTAPSALFSGNQTINVANQPVLCNSANLLPFLVAVTANDLWDPLSRNGIPDMNFDLHWLKGVISDGLMVDAMNNRI